MNCPRMVVFVLLAGLRLQAGELSQPAKSDVKICVEAGVGGPWAVMRAEKIATQMFADIGVGIEWYHDRRHCNIPPEEFLDILLSTSASDRQFPGALAYSRLADGVHIVVFYNRVAKMVDPKRVPNLLANVLVHEIAHMLEGISRHSDKGIMKAHWDEADLLQMSSTPLPFTPEDVELIRRGLAQRQIVTRLSLRRE